MLRFQTLLLLLFFLGNSVFAQRVLTEQEAIELALQNSPVLKSATLEVKQNQQLQKAAVSLPNPDVYLESPTGEFYTIGVQQSFDFPGVYAKQFQLQKQHTALAEIGQAVTESDIRFQVKSLYLALQYFNAVLAQLRVQDSLYNHVSISAERNFEAGQIDFLEKTYAESQYGEIHNQFVQAQQDYEIAKQQLLLLTKVSEDIQPASLAKNSFGISDNTPDSASVASNPLINYYRQNRLISQKHLQLERHRFVPGLVFGYLNQTEKSSDVKYRFNGGITVPLWFWQYMGNIQAAKTGVQIAEQTATAKQMEITAQMQQANGDFMKYASSLAYYENTGLKNAEGIISASGRFFESGETDLIAHLRNISEAYAIRLKYFETLRNYNQSIFQIQYLTGQL